MRENNTFIQYEFSESVLVAENVFIIMSEGIFYGFWGNVLIILSKYRQVEPPWLASEVSTYDKSCPELNCFRKIP